MSESNFLLLFPEACQTYPVAEFTKILEVRIGKYEIDVINKIGFPVICEFHQKALLSSPSPNLNPSPKSQIQSPEEREWDWG